MKKRESGGGGFSCSNKAATPAGYVRAATRLRSQLPAPQAPISTPPFPSPGNKL